MSRRAPARCPSTPLTRPIALQVRRVAGSSIDLPALLSRTDRIGGMEYEQGTAYPTPRRDQRRRPSASPRPREEAFPLRAVEGEAGQRLALRAGLLHPVVAAAVGIGRVANLGHHPCESIGIRTAPSRSRLPKPA